ncbi:S8 family serine peptidase [Jiangella aurantiaca]|nr:S8 family serine peptidase [Jiangella aurantiaca]
MPVRTRVAALTSAALLISSLTAIGATATAGVPTAGSAATAAGDAAAGDAAAGDAAEAWATKVEDDVQHTLAAGETTDVMIAFEERADLAAAARIDDWDDRGAAVVAALQQAAEESQRATRTELDAAGADYVAYWIANAILVRDATEEIARRVAAQPGVDQVLEVAQYDVPELLPAEDAPAVQAAAPEWGVAAVHADRVWTDVDVRGEGLVIANIDTGVQFDHPALAASYRGRSADGTVTHDYHWFDPAHICPSSAPCDNQGHGTHTMGTMAGGDAGGTAIGVAPGARWIAAKGCEATAQVACSITSLVASGQWTLAPTDANGRNPRIDLRPHVVNNSWGADTLGFADPFYDQIVDAWNAAGVFAVFSSGNDGANGCTTVGSPADSPGAYAVGAHDPANLIAPFSSRGPGPNGRIRPDIAAPGVAVRSSVPGSGYGTANGTSMAAPHVTATVALMWSAAPSLIGDIDGTRELLGTTAVDTPNEECGGTEQHNNAFGQGRLDAFAAVTASPIGATGLLSGVITDGESGEPVPGVLLRASSDGYQRTTVTGQDGRYDMTLVAGTYELTATAYGYAPGGAGDVTVTEGATTTLDVGLTLLLSVTVSGTVTDNSGQGWPLYAGISIGGYPHGTIWTDPATGRYEVELPATTAYTLTVRPQADGYATFSRTVEVGDDDLTVDFAATVVTTECLAPGYAPAHTGAFASFDNGLPAGWTVQTVRGNGWETGDSGQRGNLTGGEGGFASIDSASGQLLEDGMLVSPPVDLTDVAAPVLSFRTDLLLSRGVAEADVSVDGGATWQNVWRRTAHQRGPRQEQVPLPEVGGRDGVLVRFHYRNDIANNGWWQLDDVLLGARTCEPVEGGLLLGQVRDDRTGTTLDGATVSSADGSVTATTTATPADPGLGGGFYSTFVPGAGDHELTAEHDLGQHGTQRRTVTVEPGAVTRADFELGTGELEVSSAVVEETVELGGARTAMVTVTNVGTAPASFELAERNTGFEQQRETLAALPSAPLRRAIVPDDGGPLDAAAGPAAVDVPTSPGDAAWVRLHDKPDARTDGLAAVHDGKLYYVGGSTSGISQRNMVYDIALDRWDFTGSFQQPRGKPVGGFIGDRLYMVGGWGPAGMGETNTVLIYDPATDTWSTGAPAPVRFAAAGSAILDGKLYVIGGRTADQPDRGSSDVYVYDAAADSWSQVADYPEPASWQACGPIDGLVYCAGGQAPHIEHSTRGYVYNPATDAWYRIADLPKTVTFTAHTAANGLLMTSGGQVGGYRSNEGFFYDPAAGEWASLPNSIFDVYRLAGTCGFYKLGGTQGQPGTFPWVEQLPGFDDCQTATEDPVSWLSADGGRRTLEPGESAEIAVTLEASGAAAGQPGDYLARLLLLEDTPFANPALTVAMDATAPSSWGLVTGTVTGLDRCDGPEQPLAGATVRLRGALTDIEVSTDEDGVFRHWLDRSERRVTVTASADGWQPRSGAVTVVAGETVTKDLRLRRDEPCAVASPAEGLELTVRARGRAVERLTLSNDGAAAFDYAVTETAEVLRPLAEVAAVGWTDGAPVPGGRLLFAAAQCPGDPDHGYVVGGVDERIEVTRRTWRYDAAADAWTELAPIPEAGRSAVAACEAGRIHVLGGDDTDRHYVYDVARDTWSAATPLPAGLSSAAAAAWDGRVWVAGGATGGSGGASDGTVTGDVHVYDPAAGTWTPSAPLPHPVRDPAFTQAGPFLYLAGGITTDGAVSDVVQRLDLRTGTWTTGPALAEPRAGAALVATDQALYALGGAKDDPPYGRLATPTVQRLVLAGWSGGTWTIDPAAELPSPVSAAPAGFCTQARAGGEIWSIGGMGGALDRARFLPVAGERCAGLAEDVPWLDVRAATGTVAADGQLRIAVNVDAGELAAGTTHHATLLVATSDPGAPELRVPVTVHVD